MQSGAYRTILTHFSTRYPTMPLFDMDTHPNLSVAMDFMSINIKDLPWLPGMVRCMPTLWLCVTYAEHSCILCAALCA